VKTIAHRYTYMLPIITSTSDGLFRFINIGDLQRPWTSKRIFSEFFAIFGWGAYSKSALPRNDWR